MGTHPIFESDFDCLTDMESRVLSLCWLPRGKLAMQPDRINEHAPNELEMLAKAAEEEQLEELSEDDDNEDEVEKEEKVQENGDVDDLNALGFNMDDYDDEPDDVAANIGSLIVPTSKDEYDFGNGDDEEEAIDVTLKPDDHVLLAGNDCPDGTASVEVRIFNLQDEFYVRNDIQLDTPPLCMTYLNSEIGVEAAQGDNEQQQQQEYATNFVAIGCLKGIVQIWDLDILDAPGPAYTLRGHDRDAMVIALGALNDTLISGGSEGRLLLWSLRDGSKIQLGELGTSPINQCTFNGEDTIVSGDGAGVLQIFKCEKSIWTRWRTLDTGVEIEKLAVSDNVLLAVGGADGIVRVIQDGAIIAKWSAHTDEPITGLAFNTGSDFLFSSGHNVSTSLVLWDLRKHQAPGAENIIPLVKHTRVRQKASGKLFCAAICPESNSDLVLMGGESGGAQVVKLSKQSKKKKDGEGDSDEDDESDDSEVDGEDDAVNEIKEDEWETDTDSEQSGEEMED